MGYGLAHGDVHAPRTGQSELRSLGAIMATAASRSIGTKSGATLAVQGQQIIKNLRQPKG